MAGEEERMEKHQDMEGKGKCDGNQHVRKPRIPEPVLIVWNSPSEEVRGQWTPTGAEPMEQWMDGWQPVECEHFFSRILL